MKTALKALGIPGLAAGALLVAACDDDPDVVVTESAEPAEDGDSFSLSVGEDGVSMSSEDNDADGSRTAVSVGEDGVAVESQD